VRSSPTREISYKSSNYVAIRRRKKDVKSINAHNSIIVFATLLIVVFALLLTLLAVALLGLQFLLPKFVRGVFVQIGEDKGEDVRIPGNGTAFDAFFDVLQIC
jgi:nitrate reductase NapE component